MNRSNDILSAAQLPHDADCEIIQTGKCRVLLSGVHAVGRGMAPTGLHVLDVAVQLPAALFLTTSQASCTLQHWSYLMQGLSALLIGAALRKTLTTVCSRPAFMLEWIVGFSLAWLLFCPILQFRKALCLYTHRQVAGPEGKAGLLSQQALAFMRCS